MTMQELIAALVALHDPKNQESHMVYEVWQDGEITLTKGGDLYRQRSLHMIYMGVPAGFSLPGDALPVKCGNNSCIQVDSNETANKARELIVAYARHMRDLSVGA